MNKLKQTFNDKRIQEIIKDCKDAGACEGEYKKLISAKTVEEFANVLWRNINWVHENQILTDKELLLSNSGDMNSGHKNSGDWNSGDRNSGHKNSGYMNSGDRNSGDMNSGDRNSGDMNSGDMNSGYRNSGDRNSGDWNSGDMNSGDRNSGDWNSGDRNSGDMNSGDWNSGDRNSGHKNSGDRNSGHKNSGDWNSGHKNSGDWNSGHKNSGDMNSGDMNSGYRNSGDRNSGGWNSADNETGFFNSKRSELINVFNKPCKLKVWENANKPHFIYNINLTEWVNYKNMSETEKQENPNAEIMDGYLKSYTYKEAWENAYKEATEEDIKLLKELPNFDAKVFEEITGIKI